VDDIPPPPEPRAKPMKSVVLTHDDLSDLERRGQALKRARRDAEVQRQLLERTSRSRRPR